MRFEVGFVVVGIVSCIFNSLGLALRDVKDLLCRRDAYMGAVWKLNDASSRYDSYQRWQVFRGI